MQTANKYISFQIYFKIILSNFKTALSVTALKNPRGIEGSF